MLDPVRIGERSVFIVSRLDGACDFSQNSNERSRPYPI